MNSTTCYSCYSSKNVIYVHTKFLCAKCKIALTKCDICGLYCGDQCLNIFNKSITL